MQPLAPPDSAPYPDRKTGLARLFHTLVCARDGFLTALRCEAAFRQLLALHGVLVLTAFCVNLDMAERALLLALSLVSLVVELLNAALETVVDRISLELHPLSKSAKGMGSAAQSMALLTVGVVWTVVLWG